MKRSAHPLALVFLIVILQSAVIAQTAGLSPAAQEAFNKGVIAAKLPNYPLAVNFFEEARRLARNTPVVYYNLGLAESFIPGRELRAIAWFGAYLDADPTAPNQEAVRERIDMLAMRNQKNVLRVVNSLEDSAFEIFQTLGPGQGDELTAESDIRIRDVKSNNLYEVARLRAELGDVSAALKVVSSFRSAENKRRTLIETIRGQAGTDDIAGAEKTLNLLADKDWGLLAIVEAYAMNGDRAGAKRTAALISQTMQSEWANYAVVTGHTLVPSRYYTGEKDDAYWMVRLDDSSQTGWCPLNSAPFLNLAAHLKSLPTSDAQQAFEGLRATADKLVIAQVGIHRMLRAGALRWNTRALN